MICNKNFRFIHVPKTGGVSCSEYLCRALAPPVFSFNHLRFRNHKTQFKAKVVEGLKHCTLQEAFSQSQRWLHEGVPPVEKTKKFVAVIRHPYDIELSNYNFYRNGMDNALKSMLRFPSERAKIELAQGSISEFIEKVGYFRPGIRIQDYFLVDGKLLPNVTLIRFEELSIQLPLISRPYCSEFGLEFPHKNKSNVSNDADRLTREKLSQKVKDKIVQKHEWLFDNGYYLA